MTNQKTTVDSPILEVVSERFRWTKADGFVRIAGSDETHGLNRTREGALQRISSNMTFADGRRRAFLTELLGQEAISTIGSTMLSFHDGQHMVEGRRFAIRTAEIGD